MMKQLTTLALMVCLVPDVGYAWGPEGHDVIAKVAYDRLSPDLQSRFDAIMEGGKGLQVNYVDSKGREHSCGARTIDQLANWPDCVRYGGRYADTYHTHFNDIPFCPKPPAAKTPASACIGNACATRFLSLKVAEIKAPGTKPFDRAAALAFVVHIAGDMHQPLHMISNNDNGGNAIRVTFDGDQTSLHKIWDGAIIDEAYDSTPAAIEGTKALIAHGGSDWSHPNAGQADFDAWAAALHVIGVDAYNAVKPALACGAPGNANHAIGRDYINRFVPVVKEQLAKAALRLSDVLKDALAAAP